MVAVRLRGKREGDRVGWLYSTRESGAYGFGVMGCDGHGAAVSTDGCTRGKRRGITDGAHMSARGREGERAGLLCTRRWAGLARKQASQTWPP